MRRAKPQKSDAARSPVGNAPSLDHDNGSPDLTFPATRVVEALVMGSATLALSGVMLLVEGRVYTKSLTSTGIVFSFPDKVLLGWSVWAKTVVLLLLATGWAWPFLWRNRIKSAWAIFGISSVLVGSFLSIDLIVFDRHGLHLAYALRFLGEPGAIQFAGGLGMWTPAVFFCVAGSAVTVLGIVRVLRFSRSLLLVIGRPFVSRRGFVRIAFAFSFLLSAPFVMAGFTEFSRSFEHLLAIFPFDLRPADARFRRVAFDRTWLDHLDQSLRSWYTRAFFTLIQPPPADSSATFNAHGRPNVIFIVIESLNAEEVKSGHMPRLARWGAQGIALHRHYSGSNHSEPGIFTLLYARHPWGYHANLDAQTEPQSCHTFRLSGYETGYFSGVDPTWSRLREFVNTRTFERFAFERPRKGNDDDWVGWDRLALSNLRGAARGPRDRPLFALCYLNSSHLPYIYPAEYKDHPAGRADPERAGDGGRLLSDYRRSLAFLDDAVADTLEAIHPGHNIVVVTGDHGESLFHDTTHGHNTRLSEAQTRVPMFIVGPGIPRLDVFTATTHADVLPTLLHAITQQHMGIEGSTGRDLLTSLPPDEALLCCVRQDGFLELLAIRGDERMAFVVDSYSPRARLLGPKDEYGFDLPRTRGSAAPSETWLDLIEVHALPRMGVTRKNQMTRHQNKHD